MSVIVGAVIGPNIYLAADRQVDGFYESVCKIILGNNFAIGVAGWLTFQQQIAKAFRNWGEIWTEEEIEEVANAIHDAIFTHGAVAGGEPGTPPTVQCSVILATTFGLYTIAGSGLIVRHDQYATVGSGEDAAFGVLFGAAPDITVRTINLAILAASVAQHQTCGKGIDIVEVSPQSCVFIDNAESMDIALFSPKIHLV